MPSSSSSGDADKAFLAFSLGPVQSFIESAVSLRDLWSGSYILSWLTWHAMKPLLDQGTGCEIISPQVKATGIHKWLSGDRSSRDSALVPSLPNRFLAEVPAAKAEELRQACLSAVETEWNALSHGIRAWLLSKGCKNDDLQLWDKQNESFFEFRAAILPWDKADGNLLDRLQTSPTAGLNQEETLWQRRYDATVGLLQASRMVRHVPCYSGESVGGRVAVKCSLLGTYEQMGPGDFKDAESFWKNAAVKWRGHGLRLRSAERFCALGIVKRFAWEYLHESLNMENPPCYPDTATVAAAAWLQDHSDLLENSMDQATWSGQWLHQQSQQLANEADEETIPDKIWENITRARRQKRPPAYYAILMLDGDRMGDHLKGRSKIIRVSQALANFALEKVGPILKKHNGTLVYAGGDDVLAFVPATLGLACAMELNQAYRQALGGKFTLSGGMAIVHYKEDLRFALAKAREAEKAAKNAGRDAFGFAFVRRSGEHAAAVCPWNEIPLVQELVEAFENECSDRWAYRLRAYASRLAIPGMRQAFEGEVVREVARSEQETRNLLGFDTNDFVPLKLLHALDKSVDALKVLRWVQNGLNPDGYETVVGNWLTLVQGASFMAREGVA